MEEIRMRLARYKGMELEKELATFESLTKFSVQFYTDASEVFDVITRVRNIERNPTGFALNDSAILGLLVRIWKILKEIVVHYERSNGDIISLLDRQLVETAVMAKFLLLGNDSVIEDYRKCSYKDRFRVLRDAASGAEFFTTPPGQRLLASVQKKMSQEGLTEHSFEAQKANRWKLQGKSFFELFSEVEPPDLYKYLYGIPSESIHGSWNDSMDFNLNRNDDGTFSAYPFYQEVDIRFVTPLLRLCHDPYALWLKRIDAEDEYLSVVLSWIRVTNIRLFNRYEAVHAQRS